MRSLRATLLESPASFAAIWPEIASLRRQCSVEEDVLLDPIHFLAATADKRRASCSVACWDGAKLVGLVFATQHLGAGLRTGYATGGDSGRGLLICSPEDEVEVIEAAVERLFLAGIHSLQLRLHPRTFSYPDLPKLQVKFVQAVLPGDVLELGSNYEQFLGGLGKHTRRNIRYYRRRALEAGILFDPAVTDEEFLRERRRLNNISAFPLRPAHLEEIDRVLELHSRRCVMALRSADGRPLALLCGFVRGSRFYILSQWNDPTMSKFSLSIVLRGYAIEKVIENGCKQLHFMGGSSLSLGQFCPETQSLSIAIDRRGGFTAVAKRLLAAYCVRSFKTSDEVPSSLKTLAGGFLPEPLLARSLTSLSQNRSEAGERSASDAYATH